MSELSAEARKRELVAFFHELQDCQKCPLAEGRTQVVFGTGDPNADLMFVGEAPGFHEDKQGKPFVGSAGKLLDKLLEEIGLVRKQVMVLNVLKCRPPGNRDPQPLEIEKCEPHLTKQIELIRPKVICTLGNFSTKLLTGKPDGITKVHGKPQVHDLGGGPVQIFPIYHPAAALYTPSMLETLQEDFAQLPELLAESDDDPAEVLGSGTINTEQAAKPAAEQAPEGDAAADSDAEQLGLFA